MLEPSEQQNIGSEPIELLDVILAFPSCFSLCTEPALFSHRFTPLFSIDYISVSEANGLKAVRPKAGLFQAYFLWMARDQGCIRFSLRVSISGASLGMIGPQLAPTKRARQSLLN